MIPGSANPLLLASAAAAPTGYAISRSLRFNSADSAYLSRTPASAGNRRTWTWAGWVKIVRIGSFLEVLMQAGNPLLLDTLCINDGQIQYQHWDDPTSFYWRSSAILRDPSAWYHILISVDTTQASTADTVRFYVNGVQDAAQYVVYFGTYSAGYQSLINNNGTAHYVGRHDASTYSTCYLADIHFIDGQALDPTSFGEFDTNGIWQPKAYTGTYGTNGFHLAFSDNSTAGSLGDDSSNNGNNWSVNNLYVSTGSILGYASVVGIGTNPGFMFDLSINSAATGSPNSAFTWNGSINLGTGKFYAIVNAYGLSFQGPSGVSLTVNGSTYSTDRDTLRSNSDIHYQQIGLGGVFIPNADGRRTNLTPSVSSATLTQVSCSPTGGGLSNAIYAVVFVPSGVSDTDFANHVVVHNVSPVLANDSLVDVPTNGTETDTGLGGEVRGNYATFNPISVQPGYRGTRTLTNGNLDYRGDEYSPGLTAPPAESTIGVTSGKWYCEMVFTNTYIGDGSGIGISGPLGFGFIRNESTPYFVSSIPGVSDINPFGSNFTIGDVLGVALDLDNGTLDFYKNGSTYGSQIAGIPASTWFFWAWCRDSGGSGGFSAVTANFGQHPFAYTAPSGFKALCTANLPSTTITTSGSYTGNGVANGPFVYLNGVPTAMTVDGNAVTFGTDADKLSNGFKIRTTSTTFNQNASTYNYSITSTGDPFKIARAQSN